MSLRARHTSDPVRCVAVIVLAAGASTRFGQPKQLFAYGGEPLIKRAAKAALDTGARPVIIVLGANAPIIAPQLGELDDAVRIITNERWEEGLASSLSTGIGAVTSIAPQSDGVLITLADQPFVNAAALQRLLHAFDDDSRIIAAEYSGTIGVPAIVGCEYFDALCALRGDAGAGNWLRSNRSAVTRVPVSEAAIDIDTGADVQRHLAT